MLRVFGAASLAAGLAVLGALCRPAPSATVFGTTPDDEAVAALCKYVSIDTTNPPGNEKAGALFLADILKANGIEPRIVDTAPGRACVYARLSGTGKKRPLILLNHIDVVPASAQDWTHPPFEGHVYNNEIWGRGALDMKSIGIAQLMALLQIKRSGMKHDRDIIFLATPDEEASGKLGAGWLTKNHPELVSDAEFLLNEGGYIDAASDGHPRYWSVDVGEKSALWLSVSAQGDAGHASMPIAQSAPNRLVRALARIVDNPPPPHVIPPVRAFFELAAEQQPEPLRSYYKDIVNAVRQPEAYAALLKQRWASAMLRDTVSLTVLKAGYKTNVIPGEASAELDCRLLPGTDKDGFVKSIEQSIADPSVKVSTLEFDEANASPTETALYQAIRDAAANAASSLQAPVVPIITPWFTDSHWFRSLGIISYGFIPFKVDEEHMATVHGKNERIPLEVFRQGLKTYAGIVEQVCR